MVDHHVLGKVILVAGAGELQDKPDLARTKAPAAAGAHKVAAAQDLTDKDRMDRHYKADLLARTVVVVVVDIGVVAVDATLNQTGCQAVAAGQDMPLQALVQQH